MSSCMLWDTPSRLMPHSHKDIHNREDGREKLGLKPLRCQDDGESGPSKDAEQADARGREARLCFHAPWDGLGS